LTKLIKSGKYPPRRGIKSKDEFYRIFKKYEAEGKLLSNQAAKIDLKGGFFNCIDIDDNEYPNDISLLDKDLIRKDKKKYLNLRRQFREDLLDLAYNFKEKILEKANSLFGKHNHEKMAFPIIIFNKLI